MFVFGAVWCGDDDEVSVTVRRFTQEAKRIENQTKSEENER